MSAGVAGTFLPVPAPLPSDSPRRPEAFSAPDVVLLDANAAARIELGYRTVSALDKAFVTIESGAGHIELDLPVDGGSGTAADARRSVILTLSREDPIDEALYCYDVRVRDDTALVSADSTVCTVAADPGTNAERVVYLSSFESNSTLSTLALGTGAIEVIGKVGAQPAVPGELTRVALARHAADVVAGRLR